MIDKITLQNTKYLSIKYIIKAPSIDRKIPPTILDLNDNKIKIIVAAKGIIAAI